MNQQVKLKKIWKSQGYLVINLIRITPIGLMDLIAVKPNHVVFIESKEKRDSLSPLQKVMFSKLTKMGFDCYVNSEKYIL